jgi:hypothetical protein
MLVITSIFVAEVESPKAQQGKQSNEAGLDRFKDAKRELLSLYEGKNRVLPIV